MGRISAAPHDTRPTVTPTGEVVRWRDLVLSARGPEFPITRLVLAGLAIEMLRAHGEPARVTIAELAARTALARRTVQEHLLNAIRDGWLEREIPRGHRRSWRTYQFEARIPAALRGGAADGLNVEQAGVR
jgi:hypothetical protein